MVKQQLRLYINISIRDENGMGHLEVREEK